MINYKYTQTTILFTLLMVLVPTLAFAAVFTPPEGTPSESNIIIDCSNYKVTNDQNVEEDTALVKLGERYEINACKPRVNIRTTNNYLLAPLDLNVATVGKCVDGSFITNITYNTTQIDHDGDPTTDTVDTGLEFECTNVGVSNPDSESCLQGEVLTFDTNNRWQCVTAGIAGGLTCTDGQILQYTDNPDLISCSTCTVNGTAGYNSGCIGFNNSFIGGTNSISSFQCDSGVVYGSSWACADVSAASDTTITDAVIAEGLTCTEGQVLKYGKDLLSCSSCLYGSSDGVTILTGGNAATCIPAFQNFVNGNDIPSFECTSGAVYGESDWICVDSPTFSESLEALNCTNRQIISNASGGQKNCDACTVSGTGGFGGGPWSYTSPLSCQSAYNASINGTAFTLNNGAFTVYDDVTSYTCTGEILYEQDWECTTWGVTCNASNVCEITYN